MKGKKSVILNVVKNLETQVDAFQIFRIAQDDTSDGTFFTTSLFGQSNNNRG